ncbi:glycosyltransferase [Amphritea sp. HPY]|uniref:glycosyltransferase n=1 Tax=Amphritea sp. HPY TaxID=3421652 RepID=UPI003D7DAC90
MNQVHALETQPKIAFVSKDIVLAEGGGFELELSEGTSSLDVSLVIDIYDLDNPVHPEGHLGWWQFSVDSIKNSVSGSLALRNGSLDLMLDDLPVQNNWLNEQEVAFDRFVVNAVLRDNITNSIVYLDKIAGFNNDKDLAMFRAGFNRNWDTPRYETSGYIFPKESTIRLVTRNLYAGDAVGNLCLDILRMLVQNGIKAEVYAENFDLTLNDFVHRVDNLRDEAYDKDQLLYFYSTYDPYLEELLSIPFAKRVAYYHGITKPELLQVFDPELSVVCRRAYAQLSKLQGFDVLAANSLASTRTMLSQFELDIEADTGLENGFDSESNHKLQSKVIGSQGETRTLVLQLESDVKVEARWTEKDVNIIPPRLLSSCFVREKNQEVTNKGAKLLYVGRIKSHKKIEHLLELFSAYLEFDADSELWLVGGAGDKAYSDYLQWVETSQLNIAENKVRWTGHVSDEELMGCYASASAYISMSEDEGFCLPVLEAMLSGLPVFAYGVPAIREVMQEAGNYFLDKDFRYLAKHMNKLLSDSERIADMISRQRVRAQELSNQMDGRGFLNLLQPE